MVSSTEIPSATAEIMAVAVLSGMPISPIIPRFIMMGRALGMREIQPSLKERNTNNSTRKITTKAVDRLFT